MSKLKNGNDGILVVNICRECKNTFDYADTRVGGRGRLRTICQQCRDAIKDQQKVYKAEWHARQMENPSYRQSRNARNRARRNDPFVKQQEREYRRRYYDAHKEQTKITNTAYAKSEHGVQINRTKAARYRERHPDRILAYGQSERGREVSRIAARAQQATKRAEGVYSAKARTTYKRIVEENRPCNWCGAPNDGSHEIDHIVALCIGRLFLIDELNDEANLQVLCQECHKSKTRHDLRDARRLKQELAA